MRDLLSKLVILFPMLMGLPLLGVWLTGRDLVPYLQVPPLTRVVEPPGFSPVLFVGLSVLIVGTVLPFMLRFYRTWRGEVRTGSDGIQVDQAAGPARGFPMWGWGGLAFGGVAWLLAWTRMDWLSSWQMHTFTPLWMAYIIVVNALAWRRSGACMMVDRPLEFLVLFPLSGLFWWFFEYLNRFVANWYYVGGVEEMTSLQYIVFATAPFATVLPAVLGTREWLATFPLFERSFGDWERVTIRFPRVLAWSVLILAGCGLMGIGIWPDQLFPLLWVSPLLIVLGIQMIRREEGIVQELIRGDWRRVVTAALAALICGFFWEMWNLFSEAKWIYQIPYVHRAQIFEMPLLGFAGYLPFGLECLVIGDFAVKKSVLTLARGRAITNLVSPHGPAGKPAGGA